MGLMPVAPPRRPWTMNSQGGTGGRLQPTRALNRAVALLALPILVLAAHADNPKTVRVGYSPDLTHAVGIVGFCPQKQSYYKAFPGVAFDNKLFNAGPTAIEAMRAGTIDMAFAGPAEAISAFVSGHDIFVLTNTSAGGTVLVARKGSGIKTVSDLRKRKIAVPQAGSTPDVLLHYQLALNGLRPESKGGNTIVIPLDNADVTQVLRSGVVDAACVPEPWGSYAEKAAGARVVLGSGQIFNEGDYPAALLVVRKDFAEANPRFTGRFRNVTRQITLAIASHRSGFGGILKAELKRLSGVDMTDQVINNALKRCRFTPRLTQHDLQVFAKLGEVTGSVPGGARLDGIIWQ